MAVIERVSHRVGVMYLGEIVELGLRSQIFENPQHPYTKKLMSAVPVADPRKRKTELNLMTDEIPSLVKPVDYEPEKIHLTKDEAAEFYKVHQSKPFYNDLCTYLSSGPIVVMILQRENAVTENRKLMGATNPVDAEEGTLRKKYGISIDKNSVHGSDSLENAKIELDFFFNN